MRLVSLLFICLFSFVFCLSQTNAQDSSPFLAEVEIAPAKPASLTANKTKTSKKSSAPKSLNKTYKPEMVKKIVVNKPVSQNRVAQKNTKAVKNTRVASGSPSSFRGPHGNRIYSKPAYVAPTITNLSYPGTAAKRKPVIVIDAGHGGKDPGATGRLGTREKDITLRYSLALKRELERTGKYKVVMTRADDRFIELGQRVSIARRYGGDVFISIHADSIANRNTRGFSVYTISESRKAAEAKKLLARSDREEVIRGASLRGESRDVKEAIIDFAQDSTKDVSDDFAATVARYLGKKIQPLRKSRREGSLAVLTGSDIPSVLIELGYLSNEYEERLLKRDDHKQKIVTSIANAINEYFTKFKMVF
jgi:N-acetylmuramoyl-L-alanine amidase